MTEATAGAGAWPVMAAVVPMPRRARGWLAAMVGEVAIRVLGARVAPLGAALLQVPPALTGLARTVAVTEATAVTAAAAPSASKAGPVVLAA
ncbi:hypothetical protein OSJ05_25450, partial [Mycobacterium ulcerans]